MTVVNQFHEIQPRDDSGRFEPVRQIRNDGEVVMTLSEFECRMLGNRLWKLSEWYQKKEGIQIEDELRNWAKKFHRQCTTRSDVSSSKVGKKRHLDCDHQVIIKLNVFEAQWLGNRLWEVGERYDLHSQDNITAECKWWARRFHAEAGECQ